jgi:catechol 2,3-dioxygenase-like lactoylglutathione lyase family enzyme
MSEIRHMANCTNNNRRLARFYQLILGMEEVWNEEQNSPYAFYMTDGYFNLNCLQLHRTMAEVKRDVGINHFGFKVDSRAEIEKKLGELDPPIRLGSRPNDGRYTEVRILDPDGNGVDVAEQGWGRGSEQRLPGVRHVGIRTSNTERLAEFYKFVFSMKEVDRVGNPRTESRAIYLSDGTINLGLTMNPPIPRDGLQVLGFQVSSIQEIDERIRNTRGLTYKGEEPLVIEHEALGSPYRTVSLKDPDGTYLKLSEEGWAV